LTPAEQAKAQIQKNKNDVKQFEYYKRRAEEGSDHAQYELGQRYLAGKGTDVDEKLGREWLAKAAKQGYAPAAKKLAELGPAPASTAVTAATSVPTTKSAVETKAVPAEKK
jgi:TPR repeat protein